jgi:hypothetical protein
MLQPWTEAIMQDYLSARQLHDPLPCVGWAAGFSFSRAEVLMSHVAYPPPHALPHLFFGASDASLNAHALRCQHITTCIDTT